MKRTLGISILEVLGSLGVISVILTMISWYYLSQNKLYMEVSKATAQIQQLANLSYEWQTAQARADFNGISIAALQSAGLLSPNDHYTDMNPWGGNISIAPDPNDPHYVAITMQNVPNHACNNLTNRLLNVAHNQNCNDRGSYSISI